MMHWLHVLLLSASFGVLGAGVLGAGVAQAQSSGPVTAHMPLDLTLQLKENVITPDKVIIRYSIPYDGMVEFRLFDAEQELIWRDQYIQLNGENEIRLKQTALPGGEYAYTITYKGRPTEGNFAVATND